MKKYNLRKLKVEEVKTICSHHEFCVGCPLVVRNGYCPFEKLPSFWEVD